MGLFTSLFRGDAAKSVDRVAQFQTLNELASHFGGPVSLEVADPGVPLIDYDAGQTLSPAVIWKTQPSVRTVVDFIASNIASIPLHVYKRTDEGRERDRISPVAAILQKPSPARELTPYLFWKNVLIDWLTWNRAAIRVDMANGSLLRIPPSRFRFKVDEWGVISKVRIQNNQGQTRNFSPDEFLLLAGYSGPQFAGVSPVETLQGVLSETADALAFRQMMWRRQATHTGVVERSEPWASLEARQNFLAGLRAFDAKSERSGGTMLLDEGMAWKDRKPSFTPADLQDIEARKLTVVEVCSMYHVAPEMIGVRQGNYSNMEAFRQALYRDNLGPYIDGWEQAVKPLTTDFGLDDHYVEAFLDAKLRGSFEDQAKVFQTSVGAPTMTRNEARAKMNLPNVEGGDELVTPLNVMVGGQASPTDAGSQNEKSSPRGLCVKSADLTPEWAPKATEIVDRFLARQKAAVLSKIGAKAATDYWDQVRWDQELADDLHPLAYSINETVGAQVAKQLGMSVDEYSAGRASAYLKRLSQSRAEWINTKTHTDLENALRNSTDPAEVFEEAKARRGAVIAGAFVAAVAGWSLLEAGRQLAPGQGYKRWVVTSPNPRATHAAMNGEKTTINSPFSNGMQWPGDPVAGVDEVAGCMCGVEFEITP